MNKKKLDKWMKILEDKNPLNVVVLYLNKYGGFNFVIDDDLLSTIGENATKKLLEVYVEGFKKSIKESFKPFDEIIRFQGKIEVSQCPCGSDFAVAYWSEKHQQFRCKLCVGYPDDSEYYKKQREEKKNET